MVTCPCGQRSDKMECPKVRRVAESAERKEVKGKIVAVVCNEICEHEMRQKRLADAFGLDPVELQRKKEEASAFAYTHDVLDFAVHHPDFVVQVEEELSRLLASSVGCQYNFPAMPRAKRLVVREMAAAYQMESTCLDFEPQRSVSVKRVLESKSPTSILSRATSKDVEKMVDVLLCLEVSGSALHGVPVGDFLSRMGITRATVLVRERSHVILAFRTEMSRVDAAGRLRNRHMTVRECLENAEDFAEEDILADRGASASSSADGGSVGSTEWRTAKGSAGRKSGLHDDAELDAADSRMARLAQSLRSELSSDATDVTDSEERES